MGYTHYWKINGWNTPQNQPTWLQLISDAIRIIDASDLRLCSNFPDENDSDGELDSPVLNDNRTEINGVGDDGHELFEMAISDTSFACCKTARKPYDVVICCILLRAHVLAPQCIEVSSDGSWNEYEWEDARALYAQLWDANTLQRPPEINEA